MKQFIKRKLLAKKGIILDRRSQINFGCEFTGGKNCRIVNSTVHLNHMGEGSFIENAYIYGDVEIGRFVNITGPGTIVHAEVEKICIGSFSSVAPNVSIIEFNHDMSRPTTSSIQSGIFEKMPREDFISKGPIIIEEDVWIGANVVVLSGVTIGRGAVVAAGSVVNKDVPRYAVVGGTPAKVLKMRFNQERIDRFEEDKWWEWDMKKLKNNVDYFRPDGSQ